MGDPVDLLRHLVGRVVNSQVADDDDSDQGGQGYAPLGPLEFGRIEAAHGRSAIVGAQNIVGRLIGLLV
jgi:hypothetical protein